MDTNKRERTLIIVTLLLVALAGSWGGKIVLQNALRRRAQRNVLQGEVDELDKEITRNKRNARRLDEFQERSLPSNTGVASARYQNWLLGIAERAGFENTQVAKGTSRTIDNGQYTRIAFTIRGRGELEEVVRFLYSFYSEDQLHLIRFMNLKPINESRYLDITITVEAASLPTAVNEDALALGLPSPIGDREPSSFRELLERNFFMAYAPPRPEPPYREPDPPQQVEDPPEPFFDIYIHTYYSSFLVVDGEPEAWIDVRPTAEQFRLRTNDEFQLDGVDCVVRRITPEVLFVAVGESLFGILYGGTFGKAVVMLDDTRYQNYTLLEGRKEADILFPSEDEAYQVHVGDALFLNGEYYEVIDIKPEMIFFRKDDSDSIVEYGIPIEGYL